MEIYNFDIPFTGLFSIMKVKKSYSTTKDNLEKFEASFKRLLDKKSDQPKDLYTIQKYFSLVCTLHTPPPLKIF